MKDILLSEYHLSTNVTKFHNIHVILQKMYSVHYYMLFSATKAAFKVKSIYCNASQNCASTLIYYDESWSQVKK